jgi:hypothetical protein
MRRRWWSCQSAWTSRRAGRSSAATYSVLVFLASVFERSLNRNDRQERAGDGRAACDALAFECSVTWFIFQAVGQEPVLSFLR